MNEFAKRFLILAAIAILFVGGFYSISRSAQTPSLQQRVAKLRAELDSVPTDASNYRDRIQTIEDWANDLAARGLLRVPQNVMMAFYRLPEPNAQAAATVTRLSKLLGFLEDKGDRLGSLVRTDKNELIAGVYTTLTLEYTVGEVEIPKGEGIRIGQVFIANAPRLQVTDPTLDSYVTFKVTSTTAKTQPYTAYFQGVYSSIFSPAPMPGLRVTEGALKPGDKVTITLGDTSGGSRGYRPLTRDADDFRYLVEIDFDGQGSFVPAAMVSTEISGDEAALINAVVPSIVAVNEPFALRLRVEDQYWNPARFSGGTFKVSLNGKLVGQIKVPAGQYLGRLDGMKIAQEGAYKFDVVSADGRFSCQSNPVLVELSPEQRVYWGELHGHSGWEEGTGSVPRYYEYARDVAFLDFGSLTGHDLFLSKPGWEEIRRETEKANRPGQFVAYMGYEWTQTHDKGGHHNVFFKTDKGRYVQYREAPRPNLLYQKLREIDQVDNVLIIPHAHEAGDWNYNDAELERLVEIFSMHGSFEYFGQRYLRRGYRMGLIAASDDHTGHPGYAPAITATRGGLAAVYAPALDRESIWKGLKERATYATSGKRPVIKFSVDDRRVGEAVAVGKVPTFKARVLGTAALDHIDLIHNGAVEYSKDYAAPQAGDPVAVQIMLHSPTETPGDQVMPPRSGVWWGGWIEVTGGSLKSIEPLGLDHNTDEFHQVDDRRVYFTCKTRGDFDGVLLRLAQAPADAKVSVRLSYLEVDGVGTSGQRRLQRAPGPPSLRSVHEISFRVDEVAQKKGKFELTPFATIFARKAKANGSWDASFSYRPTQAPAQDDYYYLRVVQIDGEAAWTSPIWIGEQTSPRK